MRWKTATWTGAILSIPRHNPAPFTPRHGGGFALRGRRSPLGFLQTAGGRPQAVSTQSKPTGGARGGGAERRRACGLILRAVQVTKCNNYAGLDFTGGFGGAVEKGKYGRNG